MIGKTTITIVLCLGMLSLAIFYPNIAEAQNPPACLPAEKYFALASESATTKGIKAKVTIVNATACGNIADDSYAHAAVSQATSGTVDFVEGTIWTGYTGSYTSGNILSYNYVVRNAYNIANSYELVATNGTGTHNFHPAINDVVQITVKWDHRSLIGRDYYTVVFYNETQRHLITISDIWTNGQGNQGAVHTESMNHGSYAKAKFDLIKDYSGTAWSAWSNPTSGSTDGANWLCKTKIDSDTFKMGTMKSGVCVLT